MTEKIELHSQESERAVLAILLQDNDFIVNIDKWDLKSDTFFFKEHRVIFSAIMALYRKRGSVDAITLGNEVKSYGVTHYNSLSIQDYIETINITPIRKNLYSGYLDDVCKWYFLRQTRDKLKDGWEEIRGNRNLSLGELQGMVEKMAVDTTTTHVSNLDEEFVDFYGTAEEVIKGIAEGEKETGLYGPWKTWSDFFGPMGFGELFMFAARSKVGKSSILTYLSDYFVKQYPNVKVLFFDSEMESERVQTRNLAAETGIKEFYFRHGGFKDNKEMVSKAEKAFDKWKALKGRFYHIYGADKPIDEVEAIAKRFHTKHIKEDEILILTYDYVKSTGEVTSDSPEWMVIGDKANRLKKLASSLPRTIVLSAIQLNQEDNIAMSARVGWVTNYLGKLKRKSPEELEEHTDQFGTHYLETILTRSLGEFAEETIAIQRGSETKYVPNNINLKFDNFSIEDMGSFKEMVKKLDSQGRQLTLKKSDKPKRDYSLK